MKRAELTAIVKTAGIKKSNGSVNAQLMQMYIRATSQTDFRTFLQWKEAGFKVKKGEKAFGLWSRPLADLKTQKNPDAVPYEDDYSRHFVCNVFHRGQVEKI
jgi:hypothetical protein